MNYAATFVNCIVIGRANKSQLANLIGDGSVLRDAVILATVEHVILLIKYVLETLMPDVPGWVEKELKKYKLDNNSSVH
jgi:anoctamin-10